MKKSIRIMVIIFTAILATGVQHTEACTRATYIGQGNMVITGRTMDSVSYTHLTLPTILLV